MGYGKTKKILFFFLLLVINFFFFFFFLSRRVFIRGSSGSSRNESVHNNVGGCTHSCIAFVPFICHIRVHHHHSRHRCHLFHHRDIHLFHHRNIHLFHSIHSIHSIHPIHSIHLIHSIQHKSRHRCHHHLSFARLYPC